MQAMRSSGEMLTTDTGYAYVTATISASMPDSVWAFMPRVIAALKLDNWVVGRWNIARDLPGDPAPQPRELELSIHRKDRVYTTDEAKTALIHAFELAGQTLTDIVVKPGTVPTSIDSAKVALTSGGSATSEGTTKPKSNTYWWVLAALAGIGAVGYAAHWVDTHKPDRYGRLIPTR